MKGNLLLGTVYVSPINSCVYNSANERKSTIGEGLLLLKRNLLLGTVYVSPINSCVYNSVNERESTIGGGIC